MSNWLLIVLALGLVFGYALCVIFTALALKGAKDGGRIVFITKDELKDYLLVIGIKKEGLETIIMYKDSKVIAGTLRKGPLDFLKGLDLNLDDHR